MGGHGVFWVFIFYRDDIHEFFGEMLNALLITYVHTIFDILAQVFL